MQNVLKKISKKELLVLLIIIFFIFLSSKALFHSGFFRTIDDITTVRIIYLVKELQRNNWWNNFPVRWSAELAHGFGYPLYLFYAPLPYYIGALLMIFGHLSHIVATKWVYVFPLLIGPFLFYFAARQKFSKFPAFIATLFYTLFPFRGWDTYIRGGVGEAWAMAFLPGIIGSLFLMEKRQLLGGLLFSIFLALTIISHNISGLLIIFFVLILGITFYRKNKKFWYFLLLALGLSAFFWLPSFYYLNIVKVSYSTQNTGQILGFLEPWWNLFKIEIPYNPEGRFTGLFFYFYLITLLVFLTQKNRFNKIFKKEYLFWFTSSFFLYFLLSDLSLFLWQLTLPLTRILQFPWRLLVLNSFIFPLLIGLSISVINNKFLKIIFSVLILSSSLYFLPAFRPQEYSYYYEYTAENSGPCALTGIGQEYLPTWALECSDRPPKNDVEIINGKIENFKTNKINYDLTVTAEKYAEVIIYKYYFPGWNVLVDNQSVYPNYKFHRQGIFKILVPEGTHQIKIFYSKTPIMWLADLISLSSLVTLAYIFKKTVL